MGRRSHACHVATIRRIVQGRTYTYYLLRRTFREGEHVRHETLGNLSHLPPATIETIRRAVRGDPLVGPDEALEIVRSRPHGHVTAVVGTIRRLGLDRLIAAAASPARQRVVALIAARLLSPASKLATARALQRETLTSSLAETLGLDAGDEDDLYAAMDWLLLRQTRLEQALARRHLTEGTLALYDLTSSYFEGRTCPLARFGHARDGTRDKLQIVFGLLTNRDGCPVAVEVFDGNTGDPKTVATQIDKLRTRFGLTRVVLVGDRGMITSARIREDIQPVAGIEWITALRAPSIQGLVADGALQLSLFDQRDLGEISAPDFPGERLIVCRNPLLAQERRRKREALLQATATALDAIVRATQRLRRPLRGKDAIAVRVGKVIGHFKMAKHVQLTIEDHRFAYVRDEARIAREAALDGIYVIRTNVPRDVLASEEAVRWYKRLSVVERAFRSLKTVDLHVRPIGHRKADRVRAHVLLCMLAYYVEWHMRRALAPMLFDDHDPAAGEALRASVVAPARRSPAAERKARRKWTDEGQPVHSFQTLLRDLATIVKNEVRSKTGPAATFDLTTTPTPLQRCALDLLEITNLM